MEAIFLKILDMNLSASIVIAVVLVARFCLWKAPKKWSYLLWGIVGFRLCCPVSFNAVFSLFRFAPIQPETLQASGYASAIQMLPSGVAEATAPNLYFVDMDRWIATDPFAATIPQEAISVTPNPAHTWFMVSMIVWLAGLATLLGYGFVSYLKTRRRLSDAVLTGEHVFESDRIESPFILGLFRPKIYMPVGLDKDTLQYVLAHERFHIQRRDYLIKICAFLLLAVHWFNPLVWISFWLLNCDMEMSCDEKVLSREDGSAKAYSMALLTVATNRRFPTPSPLAFGETSVKSRIKNVLRWKKPKSWVALAAMAFCLIIVAACGTNPASEINPDGGEDSLSVTTPTPMPVELSGDQSDGDVPVADDVVLSEPPALTVATRQQSATAWRGTYSWDKEDEGNGTFTSVEADSAHPLDVRDVLPGITCWPDEISSTKSNEVTLLFGVEPVGVTVRCWERAQWSDNTAAGENVSVSHSEHFTFELSEGDYIYEVTAKWEQERYSGTAYYAFYGFFGHPVMDKVTVTAQDAATGKDSRLQPKPLLNISNGEETVAPYPAAYWSRTRGTSGWIVSDGEPIEQTIHDHADEIPTLVLKKGIFGSLEDGVSFTPPELIVFDEQGEVEVVRTSFSASKVPLFSLEGIGSLDDLAPGIYYFVINVQRTGDYIESEDAYEEFGYHCIFRVEIPVNESST